MTDAMLLYCEVDLLCFVFMLIIVVNLWKLRRGSKQDMIFFDGAAFMGVTLLMDMLSKVFEGRPGLAVNYILYLVNALYFVFATAAACAFWCYVDYSITEDKTEVDARLKMYKIPAVCVMFISAASIFGKFIFYIDTNNCYQKGNLYVISQICISLYFVLSWVYSLAILLRSQQVYAKRNFYRLLFNFTTLLMVGLCFQYAFIDAIIICPVASVAMFMQYSNCQNAQIQRDPLTGLNNRIRFSRYLCECCDKLSENEILSCVVFSLDSIQGINDRYGHGKGDIILAEAAGILRNVINEVPGNHFLARYSGNCFAVVTIGGVDVSDLVIKTYKESLDAYNNSIENTHLIYISYGSAIFERFDMKPEDLIIQAEKSMKKNKTENKVKKLSVEDLI